MQWRAEKRPQFVTKKVSVKLALDEQINFEAIRQAAGPWEQASGHQKSSQSRKYWYEKR